MIVDDPDDALKRVNHWLIWNIAATSLPEGLPVYPQTPPPPLARQGANTICLTGWSGPRPPVGDPPHGYRFQLFALDAPLALDPGADREALLTATRGHVLAEGAVVGRYGQSAPPPRVP